MTFAPVVIAQIAMKCIAKSAIIRCMHRCLVRSIQDESAEPQRQRGFTLIELIMVLVMLGVLAVFAAPRVFNRSDFDARGFHDATLAYLRYAQKTAIAQRRTVCVGFGINSVALRIANNASTFDCAGSNGVVFNGPDGNPALTSTNANYNNGVEPTDFSFDGLGQPVNGAGAALAVAPSFFVTNSARTITVEAATGYVHD